MEKNTKKQVTKGQRIYRGIMIAVAGICLIGTVVLALM